MEIYDLDWLKKNCLMVHYFGLGFIQLKLSRECRMHFYTPELPPITSEEDIHNHRYDFTSVILKGKLSQKIYACVFDQETHVLEEESCQSGVKCEGVKRPCGVKLLGEQFFESGSSYWTCHDTFHKVRAEECVTFLKRSDYKKDLAQVIRLKGEDSACPFSKKIEENKLWEIIEKMLKQG